MRITDKKRINFLQGQQQRRINGGLWVYFSEDCPNSSDIRKSIDDAIRASKRAKC